MDYRDPKADAPAVRSAIFVLVGAIVGATATFFFGMIVFENWDGGMHELAYRLVFGGMLVGAFVGLLAAALTRPAVPRRVRLVVLGIVGGLLAGLVYGVVSQAQASCGADDGSCGWAFLGRQFQDPWMPIALWTVFGAVTGAVLSWAAASLVRERTSTPASAASN